MKEYRLTLQRTISVIAVVHVHGSDEDSAAERFRHQLEAESCPAIEDQSMWGEVFYYQLEKAGPYVGHYEVVEVEEVTP